MSDIHQVPYTELLSKVTTATITYLLAARGEQNTFMLGVSPLDPETKVVGRARTLRFLPARGPKQSGAGGGEDNPQRLAIESIQPGDILVIDSGGDVSGGGVIGDILSARIRYLGGLAVVTDGAVRDTAQIREVGLPVWIRGVHGDGYNRGLYAADYDLPIRCAGVTVIPGDFIVADADGVVVIPPEYAAEVATVGFDKERQESWIREKIGIHGYPSTTAYPPNDDVLREYEKFAKEQRW